MTRIAGGGGRTHGSAPATATLRALQATAVVSVLALIYQFITAGQILSDNKPALDLHGAGAIAVHVLFGLTLLAATAHWRLRHAPLWPTVIAAVVFALSFLQAHLGTDDTLWAHVPGALVLTVGLVWVTSWSFSRSARN
ncbi:MAG: hypothetical protein ACRDQA_29320 [Nocardioidaceae bacterium]